MYTSASNSSTDSAYISAAFIAFTIIESMGILAIIFDVIHAKKIKKQSTSFLLIIPINTATNLLDLFNNE